MKNNFTDLTATLLERLGGEAGLDALVGAFCFNVLNDSRVAHFFASSDVEAIRKHQRSFFAASLADEGRYRGHGLREAHRQLVENRGLDESHFNAFISILAMTLEQFGHPADLILQVISRVLVVRDDVLGRT